MVKHKHIFLWVGFFACLVPLYWAKAQADKMRDNVRNLNSEIAKEEKAIRTLRAELAYLSDFSRIEKTAQNELGLKPIDPQRIKTLSELNEIAPMPVQTTSDNKTPETGGNANANP